MPSKSKIKGSCWEREVAAILTEKFNSKFERVLGSGAYAHNHELGNYRGDVWNPDFPHFNIECKCYGGNFSWSRVFKGSNEKLNSWIDQVMNDSDNDSTDMIFFKLTPARGSFVAIRSGSGVPNSLKYKYRGSIWSIADMDVFLKSNKMKGK